MLNRLIVNWVYGGFLAGILLLLLAPVIVRSWPPALVATFLCLPAYMLHQYEEHDKDRFRLMVNRTLGGGQEVLSRGAVFVINIPGVWGILGVVIVLAVTVNAGYGLISAYLVIVNAVAHIGQALRCREYNPGLITSILVFLPLGACTIVEVQRSGNGTLAMHLTGLFVALAIHAAIVAHVRFRLSHLAVGKV
jgi:hypothetical protein